MKLPEGLSYRIDPDDLATELREVKDYWDAKRGARAMPRRADIDPHELRRHLPFLWLVDVLPGAQDFRFRLIGTGITEQLGRDSTGKTLREVYTPTGPAVLKWALAICTNAVRLQRPVVGYGTLRPLDKEFVAFQSLHLPLSEDGERVGMLFGRIHFYAMAKGPAR
jgi:hypothetical protein